MLGMSLKDTWMLGLLALSGVGFLTAARWHELFQGLRALVLYSVGFSLGFVALTLWSGLAILR